MNKYDLLDLIQQNTFHNLNGKIHLKNSPPGNMRVRGRNKAIELAEAKQGLRYPREVVWVDGLENTPGVIELPYDDYSRVYVLEGTYDDPHVRFIPKGSQGDPLPYYEKKDGKTFIHVEHFSGGGGTQDNPYLVSSLSALNNVRNILSAHYLQTNDIGMAETVDWDGGAGWLPIDNFTGVYNGNGYKLTGLFIDRPDTGYVGLFASLLGNAINLGIENCFVRGSTLVGSLCGRLGMFANRVLENCYSIGDIRGTSGSGAVGGLIGGHDSSVPGEAGKIHYCHTHGTVSSMGGTVGGIIGFWRPSSISGADRSINGISDCYSTARVEGLNAVGGIVGGNSATARGHILRCISTGIVAGSSTGMVGGIFGQLTATSSNTSIIERCVALGSAIIRISGTATGYSRIGGAGGTLTENYAIENMLFKPSADDPGSTAFPNADKSIGSRNGADITEGQAKSKAFYESLGYSFE